MRSPFVALAALISFGPAASVSGFALNHNQNSRHLIPASCTVLGVQADAENYLLDEFRDYRGEMVDPYQVLKVHRSAERKEIRDKYLKLSKRYHPDVMRHKDILPGSCNNEEEVRDQWERIKLAYEILSHPKTRKRYDRHEVLSDPKAAMQRAAMDAAGGAVKGVGKGIFNVGKGLFNMGAKAAVDSIKKRDKENKA